MTGVSIILKWLLYTGVEILQNAHNYCCYNVTKGIIYCFSIYHEHNIIIDAEMCISA